MPIFKSHKVIFFAKLALLLPLSFGLLFTALLLTGAGHGIFSPLQWVLGPLNILCPIDSHLRGAYFLFGTIGLYEIYALILKFTKSNKSIFFILAIHVISSMLASVDTIVADSNNHIVWGVILLIPLIPVIWLLFSIYKSRGLW